MALIRMQDILQARPSAGTEAISNAAGRGFTSAGTSAGIGAARLSALRGLAGNRSAGTLTGTAAAIPALGSASSLPGSDYGLALESAAGRTPPAMPSVGSLGANTQPAYASGGGAAPSPGYDQALAQAYGGNGFDRNFDYQAAINYALSVGDQNAANALNAARNRKIAAGASGGTQYTDYNGSTAVTSDTPYNNGVNPNSPIAPGAAYTYGRTAQSTGNSPGGVVPNLDINNPRPQYNNGADVQLQALIDALAGEDGQYQYRYYDDPNWNAANRQYDRNAQLAGEAALSQMAGMNGGNLSSNAAAVSAGVRQAMAGMALEQIPQFGAMDLAGWNASQNSKRSAADLLQTMAQRNMNLYGMDNDLYNTDRSFGYNMQRDAMSDAQWRAEYDRAIVNDDRAYAQALEELKYKKEADAAANAIRLAGINAGGSGSSGSSGSSGVASGASGGANDITAELQRIMDLPPEQTDSALAALAKTMYSSVVDQRAQVAEWKKVIEQWRAASAAEDASNPPGGVDSKGNTVRYNDLSAAAKRVLAALPANGTEEQIYRLINDFYTKGKISLAESQKLREYLFGSRPYTFGVKVD